MLHIIYHGHSCIEIELPEWSWLIDPFITDNPKCDITLEQLLMRPLLGIIITHGHRDHVGDTFTIKQSFPSLPVWTTYGVAQVLEREYHLTDVMGVGIGGTVRSPHLSCKFVTAVHDGGILDTVYSAAPSGVLVTYENTTIYHAGDTALTMDMKLLGRVDVAFLPIGDRYTMGILDAVTATSWILPTTVVPIHYNTRPDIIADDNEFARQVMLGNYAVPKILRPGQYVVVT